MLKMLIIFPIRLYQWCLSPFLGTNCRFYPSCSQYTVECFEKYHPFKAFYRSIWRILRCQPFSKGGVDKP